MPWKECHVMDERLRFVARLLEGETMAALCEEFGISRKTGYKIYQRYKDCGRAGPDGSQPPALSPCESAADGRREADRPAQAGVPDWGAPKIRERLRQRWPERALSGDQHRACGAGSPRPGAPSAPATRRGADGHRAVLADRAQRALVRGLQGRVHARQSALLLSADDHRLRQPLSARLRGAVHDQGTLRLPGLRARL